MNNTRNILILVILLTHNNFFAQTKSFSVTIAPFSSLTNDEFSPVYYENGIVFCSDLKNNSLITYKSDQKKLINIYYVKTKDSIHWENVRLLAKGLTTNYNDGPVTFNDKQNIIYYCRNNNITNLIKDFSDTTNKLGIYSAEFTNSKWTNIKSFTYNNPSYSFITPALTADGSRLYFASDMPGGYGGTDLYYCDWNKTDWDKPVNLGPDINTHKNESYPFACKSGKLFFASDGLEGFGGKDIYYSQNIDDKWLRPVHLDAEINTPDDDFGLITDENFKNGFFSSNRLKTDDIFSFKANEVEFKDCDSIMKNNYCFLFYDEFQDEYSSTSLTYNWSFSDGAKKKGLKVTHCFPGPGEYTIKLEVIDNLTDTLINQVSYDIELEEIRQVYINSPDAGIINTPISFDGLGTNLPDFNISDYLWSFGDGFNARGPIVSKTFKTKGEYTVQLGLLGSKDSLGNGSKMCGYKKIRIFNDYQELAMMTAKEIRDFNQFHMDESQQMSDVVKHDSVGIESNEEEKINSLETVIYLLDELTVSQKEIIFENLYAAKVIDIKMNDTGISATSYPVLNKFVKVLKENPDLRLEIAVHFNENRINMNPLEISEEWALKLHSYFLDCEINEKQLHTKGYGDLRPNTIKNKRGNCNSDKRVEIIFINNSK